MKEQRRVPNVAVSDEAERQPPRIQRAHCQGEICVSNHCNLLQWKERARAAVCCKHSPSLSAFDRESVYIVYNVYIVYIVCIV